MHFMSLRQRTKRALKRTVYIHIIKRKFMHFKALSAFGDVLVLQQHPIQTEPQMANHRFQHQHVLYFFFFFFFGVCRYNISYHQRSQVASTTSYTRKYDYKLYTDTLKSHAFNPHIIQNSLYITPQNVSQSLSTRSHQITLFSASGTINLP